MRGFFDFDDEHDHLNFIDREHAERIFTGGGTASRFKAIFDQLKKQQAKQQREEATGVKFNGWYDDDKELQYLQAKERNEKWSNPSVGKWLPVYESMDVARYSHGADFKGGITVYLYGRDNECVFEKFYSYNEYQGFLMICQSNLAVKFMFERYSFEVERDIIYGLVREHANMLNLPNLDLEELVIHKI